MKVTKSNTQTIVNNLDLEGQRSRAEYLELMQKRIDELEEELKSYKDARRALFNALNEGNGVRQP